MLVQNQVGPIATTTSIAPGLQSPQRAGQLGDTIVSELHGRYYEGAYRRARFGGAMQAVIATATIAGLSTSITGVPVLYNPIGNTNNVVLEKVGVSLLLAPAAPLAFGIAVGYNGATALSGTLTSVTPRSKFVGLGAAPTAGMYASAAITLPTAPTLDTIFGTLDTGAITTTTTNGSLYDLEGSIILPPGGYVVFYTSAVLVASALLVSYQWEEVPI